MALNNPEVLIKMKADIGMKDPPTLAALVSLMSKTFHLKESTSSEVELLSWLLTGRWGGGAEKETKWPSAARQLTSSSRVFREETAWQADDSCTHVHEYSTQNALRFCESGIYCNFLDQRDLQGAQTHICDSLAS